MCNRSTINNKGNSIEKMGGRGCNYANYRDPLIQGGHQSGILKKMDMSGILKKTGYVGDIFSSHWEVGSSMNCFVTEGGGGGGGRRSG